MIRLFDTHTHLLDRKFDIDRQAPSFVSWA